LQNIKNELPFDRMTISHKSLIFISYFFLISGCKTPESFLFTKPANCEKIELQGFHNLYKIDTNLYRSEQPNKRGMLLLNSIGVKTVINFRQSQTDNRKSKQTDLDLVNIPLNAAAISYENIVTSMRVIKNSKKPILLHCKYGSDRTGCMVAVYRMAISGWTKEQAINELRYKGFGYHENYYPNILLLLNNIDIEQLKKDIALPNTIY
jgi:tyrosine-protein phosphatase SIW14